MSARMLSIRSPWRVLVVSMAILFGWLIMAGLQIAEAHQDYGAGPYKLRIGWLDEPVLVGSKNGIDLTVTVSGTDKVVTGMADKLKFQVSTGPKTASYDLQESDEQPGHYFANFIPTRPGQYTFQVTGVISGTPVNVTATPEEVQESSTLEFPEPQLTSAQLQQQTTAARDDVSAARTLSMVGLGAGVLGMVLGGAALVLKRNR